MATGPALEDLDALRARVAARRAEVEAKRRGRPAAELLCRLPASIGRIGASGTLEEAGFDDDGEVVGRAAMDFIPPASRAGVRALLDRVLTTGRGETFETAVDLPDGSQRQYVTRYGPDDRAGRAPGVLYVALEITELKRTLEALRDRTAEIQTVLLATGMGSFRYEVAEDAWRLDETLVRRLGLDPRTMAEALEVVHPDDRARAGDTLARAIATGEVQEEEVRILDREGQVRWFLFRGRSVEPGKIIGGALEITGERRLRAELLRARSAEAMGRFAAGIAHNFNNMLAAVLARLDFVLRDARPEVRPGLLAAIDAGTAAAATVRDLLRLGRQGAPGRREPVELGGLVRRCLELARFAFAAGIEPLVSVPGVPHVFVDEGALERLLLELIVRIGGRGVALGAPVLEPIDGVGAGPPSARFTLAADRAPLDQGEVAALEATLVGVGGARVVLGAEGDRRTLALIFEGHRAGVAASADRRVLVVDDDAPVRQAIHNVLEDAGYPVRSATDGLAALAQLAVEPAALVLLDFSMPGLAGKELIAELRRRVPGARILLFSGGAIDEDVLRSVDGFLAKPVRIDELLDAVQDGLGGGG